MEPYKTKTFLQTMDGTLNTCKRGLKGYNGLHSWTSQTPYTLSTDPLKVRGLPVKNLWPSYLTFDCSANKSLLTAWDYFFFTIDVRKVSIDILQKFSKFISSLFFYFEAVIRIAMWLKMNSHLLPRLLLIFENWLSNNIP